MLGNIECFCKSEEIGYGGIAKYWYSDGPNQVYKFNGISKGVSKE